IALDHSKLKYLKLFERKPRLPILAGCLMPPRLVDWAPHRIPTNHFPFVLKPAKLRVSVVTRRVANCTNEFYRCNEHFKNTPPGFRVPSRSPNQFFLSDMQHVS